MAAQPTATTFADLTPDALRAVLRRLELCDAAAMACVCRPLRALCGEEPLWRALCAAWGAAHVAAPFDVDLARRALRLASFRSLRRVLHAWRGNPLGVWRVEAPGGGEGGEPHPAGGLVLAGLFGRSLLVAHFPSDANTRVRVARSVERQYHMLGLERYDETPSAAGGPAAPLLLVTERMAGLATRVSCDRNDPDVLWCTYGALNDYDDGEGLDEEVRELLTTDGTPDGRPALKLRRVTGLPVGWSALPAEGEAEACCLRPGLYTASYGPHGQEVILVRRCPAGAAAAQPLPEQLPADVARWEGVKVSGDRNVPAGKLTFVAAPAEPSAEALQQALAEQRVIVSFGIPDLPAFVSLQDRGLHAARHAWGQINVEPGEWAPQWVPRCTLLEYGAAHTPAAAALGAGALPIAFSMLWNDDARMAHIIDFTPLSPYLLEQAGAVEWAQLQTMHVRHLVAWGLQRAL